MRRLALLLIVLVWPVSAWGQTTAAPSDGVSRVMRELERILLTADTAGFLALMTPDAGATSTEFLEEWIEPGVTRSIVQERLRAESAEVSQGEGFDIYADALVEVGRQGRIGTLLIVLRRDVPAVNAWRIDKLTVITTVRGLYKLALNPEKQFTVTNLSLTAEDFSLTLPQGVAFVAEIDSGTTGIVLIGRGEATFSPAPEPEQGQVRIYGGADTLQTRFSWLYVRVHPTDFASHIAASSLQARPVDPRDFRRADAVFQTNLALSFGLDLADLSRDTWSVAPKVGDLVVELQADRSHLTYMRSASDQEDIRFFDRTRQRTISVYASKDKLAKRGPFYSEDDQADYDILNYEIDASLDPRREWIEGRATLLVTPRRGPLTTLTVNLAEQLAIHSVVSRRFGYVMALRVTGQSNVIINLPSPLQPNTALDLEFTYGGRLPAVPPEREALDLAAAQQRDQPPADFFAIQPAPSYIYTGRSNWYPQGQVTDYATAQLTLRVPESYATIASGALDEGFPKLLAADGREPAWKEYRFSATQPVRYLGWATSKFVRVDAATVSIPAEEGASPFAGVSYHDSDVSLESTAILQGRVRPLSAETQSLMKFYGSLVGDMPYQSFTLAVVERNTPGGHSPPYFAALNQPPPATPVAWRTDPAYFDGFPAFFLAHEVAHQWWGQAVGWKNYHEQWLSEGLSQYFAALYAEQMKRPDVFEQVVRQMTRWTIDRSDQGPVYLGYRLGHIKNDSRTFRALVYNKGALTLHMLRRLLGDDVFFRGIRRFYTTWRFRKAGTEDLRAAFEAEAKQPLDHFFQRWIYGSTLPRLRFTYTTESGAVVARFEQVGEVFDVPVTVTVQYANSAIDVIVPVTGQIVEHRIPTTGQVRGVQANKDDAAPVIFVK
ncbi:MAG: hypothetical protein EXQ55_02735 [Acidobacteria bacterium]|nr:hypothetical protein [Acidobacteriota bacterium]